MKYFIISNDYKSSLFLAESLEKKIKKFGWIMDEHHPNYVFVIGGDGTFLKAFQKYQNINDLIFIPFKSGGIGFYTNHNIIDESETLIKDINNNKVNIKEYEVLEIINKDKTHYALNEFKTFNEFKPAYIEILINGEYLEKFRGTGLVFSTSNGSTGFIKSSGGAIILDKNQGIYQMQELNPVSTNKFRTLNSPLILSKENVVKLIFENPNERLILDTTEISLNSNEITVSMSKNKVKIGFVSQKPTSQIDLLRDLFIKDKDIEV